MSADPTMTATGVQDAGDVRCWRCDISDVPNRMVHLGNHPEVNLCLRCAHFVHQQTWEIEDEGKGGPAGESDYALWTAGSGHLFGACRVTICKNPLTAPAGPSP